MNWFLCPFSRPENVKLVEENWLNQSIDTKLLVIANGCEYKGNATKIITIDNKSAVKALNIGLNYLKENDLKGVYARMDDDDIYLPNYINDVEISLIDADYSVISVTNIQLTNNEIIKFGMEGLHISSGGTIASRISESVYFQNKFPIEDSFWCEDMYKLKKRFKSRSSDSYIRIRHKGCASVMTDDQFKRIGSFS